MIGLSLLLMVAQAAPRNTVDGLPIGTLPRQDLPATGCAAFLWTLGATRTMVAMAVADPGQLRVSIDGKIIDLARTAQTGAGGYGFPDVAEYAGGGVQAVLDMTIVTRTDLKKGAAVPEATLRIERPGQDGFVMPVAGLVGCR